MSKFVTRALGVLVLLLAAWLITGCAATPAPSQFAQCIDLVAGKTIYSPDRLRAAEWCAENMP